MTAEDKELAELEQRAAAGDAMATRELRMRKLADFADRRLTGDLKPDANGRIEEEAAK